MKKLFITKLLILLIFAMTSCVGSDSSTSDNDPDVKKLSVYGVAEQYVKQHLKSPSSAQFPETSEKLRHVVNTGNEVYLVDSWVDSQNSFGAMLRTKFHLKVTVVGDNANFSDFQLGEN
ncbi:MAG: hypothetical protein WCK09_00425 [Bacteroidota bacterium]